MPYPKYYWLDRRLWIVHFLCYILSSKCSLWVSSPWTPWSCPFFLWVTKCSNSYNFRGRNIKHTIPVHFPSIHKWLKPSYRFIWDCVIKRAQCLSRKLVTLLGKSKPTTTICSIWINIVSLGAYTHSKLQLLVNFCPVKFQQEFHENFSLFVLMDLLSVHTWLNPEKHKMWECISPGCNCNVTACSACFYSI